MSHTKEAAAPSLVELTCAACGASFKRARWEAPKNGHRPACSRRCAARLGKGMTGRRATLPRIDGYAIMNGYLRRYDRRAGRNVFQHREVIEEHLGRRLRRDEHVDHVNGNRSDNRLENLQVLTPSQHSKLTRSRTSKRIWQLEAELAEYRRLYGSLPEVPSSPGAASTAAPTSTQEAIQ